MDSNLNIIDLNILLSLKLQVWFYRNLLPIIHSLQHKFKYDRYSDERKGEETVKVFVNILTGTR